MFERLLRVFWHDETKSPIQQPAGATVLDRLRRSCVRQTLNHEHRLHDDHASSPALDQPDPHDLDRQLLKDTESPKDTLHEVAMGSTPSLPIQVSPDAVTVPSSLQRLRNWLKGKSPVAADRRANPRHAFGQMHSQLRISIGSAKWPAAVADISKTGISLILGLRQAQGTALKLAILDRGSGTIYPVETTVVRLVLRADGQWLTCCAFNVPLDTRALHELL